MTRVLSVASEVFPLIKTGGLADVAGALPGALAPLGVEMKTLVPGYRQVVAALTDRREAYYFADLWGGEARLMAGKAAGLDLFVIEAPHLYDRDGGPYLTPEGFDWGDNWRRFAALGFVAGQIGQGVVEGWRPDIVHGHDWQAGLMPAYLRYAGSPARSVITIHNLAFPGYFGWEVFGELGLPEHAFSVEGVEYYGGVGYLKAGLRLADAITTVSPTYAAEIRSIEFGMGMDGLLNERAGDLHGILNGIDTNVWNPARDKALSKPYKAASLDDKALSKAAIIARFRLEPGEGPLFVVVSRLTEQKGMDMLLQALDGLVAMGGRLAVLGSGDPGLEEGFRRAVQLHPGRVGFSTGYDERLSHLMQGGADAILVPSRFEPCGLTQMIGLRYGTLPVVSRVGGLADTVIDANEAALRANVATGIVFSPVTAHQLYEAIARTVRLYADTVQWRKIQKQAMKADVSWERSAREYAGLYRKLLGGGMEDGEW